MLIQHQEKHTIDAFKGHLPALTVEHRPAATKSRFDFKFCQDEIERVIYFAEAVGNIG